MKLLKRVLSYYKDFIFQSVVFYMLMISPLGSIGWKIGIFETSIIEHLFRDFLEEPMQLPIRIIWGLSVSPIYSFPISISNIYLWHFNKFRIGEDDYLPLKILFMFSVSGLYIAYSAKAFGHFGSLTLIYLFPIALTTLLYIFWLLWREKRHIIARVSLRAQHEQ
jgi:hypothetical protein